MGMIHDCKYYELIIKSYWRVLIRVEFCAAQQKRHVHLFFFFFFFFFFLDSTVGTIESFYLSYLTGIMGTALPI